MCDCNDENIDNNGNPIGGGGEDLTSLENKTQNIDENQTSPLTTTILGELLLKDNTNILGLINNGANVNTISSLDTNDPTGQADLDIYSKNTFVYQPVITSKTTFTNSNELVSKAYVDSVAGGIEVGTLAQMLSKTGMSEGNQFFVNANAGTSFTSQENKLYYYSGRTWQVSGETIELVAKENLLKGQVLQISGTGATADFQAERTTTTGDVDVIGIVANQDVAAGDWFTCAISGIWSVACITGTYTRGNYLKSHTTDGYAQQTTSESDQPFSRILENRSVNILGTGVFALLNIIAEVY